MNYVNCRTCAAAFDADHAARCPRCGAFLGAQASLPDQVTACVDRLGALLASADDATRAELACGLRATPPCAERETTRWTNAVSAAVATALVPATPAPRDRGAEERAFSLGFWLGVLATMREVAEARLTARLPSVSRALARWR